MLRILIVLMVAFSFCTPTFAAKRPRTKVNYRKALEKAKLTLRIAPEVPKHHFDVANLYQKMKQPSKAAIIYKRMLNDKRIKQKTVKFKAHFYLASIYLFKKKLKPSIYHYKKAIRLNPLSTPARVNLGTAYLNSKRYIPALDEYLQVLNNNPNYAIVYFNVAKCYEKIGKFNKARNSYRTFLSIIKKDGSRSVKRYKKYLKIAKAKLRSKKGKSRVINSGKLITLPKSKR